ncbi:MAG TPA: bacillithiol biosynthesis cysteine-adding enzyme BshC, partial [Pyrinomonadaceae bacterium]|jgi:bacillithiol biosynthesis cysteine-adding enzyme BshC|nr:bacillithiol biosynthesis cysteine-adding enzyme BshC [Pyrinomonadaceae bacterium]
LSTAEPACYSTPEESGLRVETLSFDRIPHQTRLFLDYLRDPIALREFYPSAVRFHHELSSRAPEVLAAHQTDRNALCDALQDMNAAWGAGEETLKNIQLLRDADCLAVVSGQQAGLFSGPLYTIYKALAAVKLAGCLTQRKTKAVPVFWIATEDHDFPEVAKAEFIGRDCKLAGVEMPADLHAEGQPVGRVVIDNSIDGVLTQLLELLPVSEFTPDLEVVLRDAWRPGRSYGEAFARMLTSLLGSHGLVLLDPLDQRLKAMAAPLYARAALRAHDIATAIEVRSRRLVEAGYHAQVTASENSFPLFLHDDQGARHALTRSSDGRYATKHGDKSYTVEELSNLALAQPEKFSPNVTLRAVVQDYLLPTIAYYGGAAEIAYFAQTGEVYRLLERPITPILPRSSLTMVERHTGRVLERYGLGLADLFAGQESVLKRVVEEYLGAETAQSFAKAEGTVNSELDQLREQLRSVDPTLADALETGRRKINHQFEGLRTRFHRAQMARDEAAQRQLQRAFDQLFPNKELQERHINITSLLSRHGRYVVDWIYNAINIGSNEHQIVYL